MPVPHPTRCKFALHGPGIEIACEVPAMAAQVRRLFEPFAVPGWPEGFVPTVGVVRPFAQAEVLRHLSPTAKPVANAFSGEVELYEDGDRFWLVDDRWGMVEVNLIRGQFRSWVLPQPRVDPIRCAEHAIVWPLAQLLRARGLFMLPAVSVVRDGWAVMILSPSPLEAELVALIRAGYKVIGQRWTAVREEDGRLALLHLPGAVERSFVPRLRAEPGGGGTTAESGWVDLAFEYLGSWQNHAFCDAVLVADSGRRGSAFIRDVEPAAAHETLRRAWPIVELHPQRKYGQLPLKLAHHARVCELQLSRNPHDLIDLLTTLRLTPSGGMVSDTDPELAITPWRSLEPATSLRQSAA